MTHGIDRRQTRTLYFGRIIGCTRCGYESGDLLGVYRKNPTAKVWRLKRWRILHHPGSPCTPFYRVSCDIPKEELARYGGAFQWGSNKPLNVSIDWSIPADKFPDSGRYVNPHWDWKKYIEKYGIERWRAEVGSEFVKIMLPHLNSSPRRTA